MWRRASPAASLLQTATLTEDRVGCGQTLSLLSRRCWWCGGPVRRVRRRGGTAAGHRTSSSRCTSGPNIAAPRCSTRSEGAARGSEHQPASGVPRASLLTGAECWWALRPLRAPVHSHGTNTGAHAPLSKAQLGGSSKWPPWELADAPPFMAPPALACWVSRAGAHHA